jgi:PAS domain S-box-containing protein
LDLSAQLALLGGAIVALLAATTCFWAWRRSRRAREVERALSEALKRYESMVNLSADAIITIDDAHNVVTYNSGAETVFGWELREIVGRPLNTLIPERFRSAHSRHVQAFAKAPEVARRMGERRPVFGLRRDGTEFPADASIARLDLPSGRLFSVVLRDASVQVRREANERFLAKAGATLASSLDYEGTLQSIAHVALPLTADCAVLDVVEQDGSIRRIASTHDDDVATKALRTLNGRLSAPNNSPFPTARVIARSVAMDETQAECWATGDGENAVLRAIGARGCLTLLLRARERVVGALHLIATTEGRVFDDATRELAKELAFRAALTLENASLYRAAQRATSLRDEIVSVVSHDLRNPLSAISMCSKVLLTNPPADPAERARLLDAIAEASALAERLIRDLLDASLIASGQLRLTVESEPLEPLLTRLRSLFEQAARQRDITLLVEGPPNADSIEVDIDSERVLQVLSNLVANAIKFTEPGGTVHVTSTLDEATVRVAVRDSGVGIPRDDLAHIFDRYWHSKRKGRAIGSGLGLAIARGIVEAHGGTIRAESEPGRGSTFTFALPRRRELTDGA